jgi:hypothetical protein
LVGSAWGPGGGRRFARGNGVAQGDVHAVAAADVAHRGEASQQRALGVADTAVGTVGRVGAERVAHGLGLRPRLAGQVRVHVHQSGQARVRAEVDAVAGGVPGGPRPDRRETAVGDGDRHAFQPTPGLHVEQPPAFDRRRGSGRGDGAGQDQREGT